MDAHVSDELRYAFIDLWTPNPHLHDKSPLPSFQPRPQNQQTQSAIFGNQLWPKLQVTPDKLMSFLPLSTNLPFKNKRNMLHFPTDFWELNINGLTDTSTLSSAIPEADLRKNRLLALRTILYERPPPGMVANG